MTTSEVNGAQAQRNRGIQSKTCEIYVQYSTLRVIAYGKGINRRGTGGNVPPPPTFKTRGGGIISFAPPPPPLWGIKAMIEKHFLVSSFLCMF